MSDDEELPDRIVVDLWLRWTDRVPTFEPPHGTGVHVHKGRTSWNLGRWDFAPERWEDRQLRLDEALLAAVKIGEGLPPVPLEWDKVYFHLFIEQYPEGQTAGVSVSPEMLRAIADRNYVLMLNAF